MSALTLLRSLYAYQAWAHDEFLQKLRQLDPERHGAACEKALRLFNHSYVVGQIFAAHLVGEAPAFSSDNTDDTPTLEALRLAVTASDRWYLQYLLTVKPEDLIQPVPFVFTDGDRGCMTREEMLTHVVLHCGYHRGEIGQILSQLSLDLPWDTYAVYLHRSEPRRRLAG